MNIVMYILCVFIILIFNIILKHNILLLTWQHFILFSEMFRSFFRYKYATLYNMVWQYTRGILLFLHNKNNVSHIIILAKLRTSNVFFYNVKLSCYVYILHFQLLLYNSNIWINNKINLRLIFRWIFQTSFIILVTICN